MSVIRPGSKMTISGDVLVDGVVAFKRGEEVLVEDDSPNPQMPQYRYVVLSRKLGRRFQLRDADLMVPMMSQGYQQQDGGVVAGPVQGQFAPSDAFADKGSPTPFAEVTPAFSDSVQPTTAHREYVRRNKAIENVVSVLICLGGIVVFLWVSMWIGIGLFVVGIGLLGYTNRY